MAYGKNTKPLVVGLPADIKKGIEQIAARNSIAEAEVVRRFCRYLLNNPAILERVVNPAVSGKKPAAGPGLFRGVNCSPKQYIE